VDEQLRLLVELQHLDSQIIAKSKTVKEIPGKVTTIEKPLKRARALLEKERQGQEAMEKKRRDKERELNESNDRIEKLKERIADIKDNKAYQAHLKEIESAEKHTYAIEDEILALMEALEEEGKKIKEAEKAFDEEEQTVNQQKKELEEEIGQAEKGLEEMKAQRKAFTEPLEDKYYETYMTLLKNAGGLAVTEARDEVCTGCNMNIMPQFFVELKKNDTINKCPQCRRILYYKEPAVK
jgi:predicted  nucleic acid-binding Zn-ribbon protein